MDRSIDLFDLPKYDERHGTTHVHAYLSGESDTYTLFVKRYHTTVGLRVYTFSATREREVERFAQFSAKRLAALAADPGVVGLARALAGL
jgi:hypothetical protein